ncbi:XkdX family protein [Paenibacillus apiarius]|nr:XkdX family protein [Paenibacillus apiarius]
MQHCFYITPSLMPRANNSRKSMQPCCSNWQRKGCYNMDWFITIKRYYDMGIYKKDRNDSLYVGKFCEFNKLSTEQYKEITGEQYPV